MSTPIQQTRRWREVVRWEIAARDGFACRMCGRLIGDRFECDHIKPLIDGGTNDYSNLQTLCNRCHTRKTTEENERRDRRRAWRELVADDV